MPKLRAMIWFCLGLAALPSRMVHAQPAVQIGDVSDPGERIVSLTDGAIYRGELLEYVPRHHIVLRLSSGQVRRFEWAQIKRATMARPGGQAALPSVEVPTAPTPPPRRPAPAPSAPPLPAANQAEEFESERDAAYHEHIRRAKALYEDEQFTKALAELDAAYRLSPKPIVLYSMARAHQLLSHYREAYDLYQRYLAKEPNIPEQRRAQIQGYIIELTAAAQQARVREQGLDAFAQSSSEEKRPTVYRRSMGMLVTGSILLPVAYSAAAITGALGLAGSSSLAGSYSEATISTARWALGSLLIPVAGPFVSAGIVHDVTWSLPWAFIDGAAQVTGLALIIAGSRPRRVVREEPQAMLLPYSSPSGSGLVLVGTFN